MSAPESMSHEEAIELLPWLVNGSLHPSETEPVRVHARSCVVCRRELETLNELRDFVVDGAMAEAIPESDMRNINARIDHMIERKSWGSSLISWLHAHFASPWKLAFAAQTILVIGLAAALMWPPTPEPVFTTLTQAELMPGKHRVRVVFTPQTTLAEVTFLLRDTQLTVQSGPSARGVYTLAFPETLGPQEREQLLGHLQSLPAVQFAQNVAQYPPGDP